MKNRFHKCCALQNKFEFIRSDNKHRQIIWRNPHTQKVKTEYLNFEMVPVVYEFIVEIEVSLTDCDNRWKVAYKIDQDVISWFARSKLFT